jgi:hypothetical protein
MLDLYLYLYSKTSLTSRDFTEDWQTKKPFI